ncbi:MAG: tetratricopeptide repeat-containing sensor histidine kinase, partial [Mucilaginibacter sp.]
ISMARSLKQDRLLGNAYLAKAKNYEYKTELKKAISTLFLALKLYERAGTKADIATCYIRIAYNYYAIADYAASNDYAQQAVNLAKQIGDKKLYILCLSALGNSYNLLADYPKAINCYLTQLRLVEQMHDIAYNAKVLGNIGVVYYYLKKYPEALEYYNRCLNALEQVHDKLWIPAALNNIGAVYMDMGDYSRVIDYNQRALILNRQNKSIKGEANDLADMSVAYTHMNRYQEAFNCLDEAMAIFQKIGAKNNLSIGAGQMASLYMDAPASVLLKRGMRSSKRLAEAKKWQQKAIALAKATQNVNNEADQWKNMSQVLERQQDYKGALLSYRNYTVLKDSIFNDKKRQELTRLNIQYDFDKKAAALKAKHIQEQTRAEAEIARQKVIKNASIIIGLAVLIFGGITLVFYERRKHAKEQLKEVAMKARMVETELKALRSQLNPHFIFNSLNSIGDYIGRHDKLTADLYLVKFAKLMRKILENSEHQMISLANDLETLELYMQLEALRLDNKFRYRIEVEEGLDSENTLVPPMLLQPFVENSIWHGISPKNGSGNITVKAMKHDDMIEYTVEDDGIGRERSSRLKLELKRPARRSFSIGAIQSRINMINESRQNKARVELTDLDQGTRVSIRIPYELDF